ncbi:MAG TPA: tripartite tricarboxylate transporter substrate binding protein [Burkholderiales bacterium]|nr:tripartite tricarboxylate transporter substrate binding protein [Burkholderiales bacterium]
MNTLKPWRLSAALASVLLILVPNSSHGQVYPTKPVRIIVPWTPGGTADLLARILAQKMSEAFGHQVVVDNRPGAGGLIGTEFAAKAAPDGYTLLMGTTAPNSVAPSLYPKIPFDPTRDFAYISLVARTCYVLSVHPSMPVRTVRDLIALAKSRPGQLTFSSPGSGTPNHLSGEMFKMLTGVDMQHVPYKGSAQAVGDVIAGHIALTFENITVVSTYVKSGRVRGLGVTNLKRSPVLPDVPTLAESGIPAFEAVGWFGMVAPAATPRDIIAKLNGEVVRILALTDVKDRITGLGAEIVATSPEEFDQFNRSQIAKWTKVVRFSGARAD